MGKGKSSQKMVLWKPDIHMQKNEIGPLHHIKNKLKMDYRPKYKTIKLLEENRQNTL